MLNMYPLDATALGYSPLHPGLSHSGYAIFIHENALGFLNQAIQDNYASFKLVRRIIAMRSNPRPWDGGIKRGTTDHRQLAIEGIWVNYFIESGCVYIENITPNFNAASKHELPGLHLVSKSSDGWRISRAYVNDITTKYAAINGHDNNLNSAATEIMPHQLLSAYSDEEINEYTLFHNPAKGVFSSYYDSTRDKLGFTPPLTKRFSELLQSTQKKQSEVKWVTHNQGSLIFTQAINFHNKMFGGSLNKHSVYFQNPANNMLTSNKILNRAQVRLHNGNNNIGTTCYVKPSSSMTQLSRATFSPFTLMYGMMPLALSSTNYAEHKITNKDIRHYGEKVASSSRGVVKRLMNKVV